MMVKYLCNPFPRWFEKKKKFVCINSNDYFIYTQFKEKKTTKNEKHQRDKIELREREREECVGVGLGG